MNVAGEPMRFTDATLAAFASLSRDLSPLHFDAAYARRTPFGRPVVYGVAVVLRALGTWAEGHPILIHRLRAEFRRPLYVGVEYGVRVTSSGDETTIDIVKGAVPQTRVWLRAERVGAGWRHVAPTASATIHEVSKSPEPAGLGTTDVAGYTSTQSAHDLAPFGIRPGQLAWEQLNALLWCSYFVGMDYPGRQALLFDMDLAFAALSLTAGPLLPTKVECTFDPRLALATISGSGGALASLRLRALWRPEPVPSPLHEVVERVGASRRFTARRALVLGSSRGFGAALAQTLAIEGADVVLHGHAPSAELGERERDLRAAGARVQSLAVDLASPGAESALRDVSGSGWDIVVLNASPPIAASGFLEQDSQELAGFVTASLALVERPLRAVLPALREGGTIIGISTNYLAAPRAGFAHYLAAKGALEGLLRAIAVELPERTFVIARAPRMLTDQTNIPIDRESRASSHDVACRLIDHLARLDGRRGLVEIDLGSPLPNDE